MRRCLSGVGLVLEAYYPPHPPAPSPEIEKMISGEGEPSHPSPDDSSIVVRRGAGGEAEQLRKAGEVLGAVQLPQEPDVRLLTHPAELTLIRKMLELPVIIDQAVRDLAPHHLTYYARDLGSAFSQFYRDCQVLDAAQPDRTAARLQLCRAAQITLARTLALMGMSAPESM